MFASSPIQSRAHTSWLRRCRRRGGFLLTSARILALFFIGVVGLRPDQYGSDLQRLFGGGHGRCAARRPARPPSCLSAASVLTIGLTLSTAAAAGLLTITLAGSAQPAAVAMLLMAVALAFGMTMPNIMNATMEPLPDIAGAVSAAAGSIQMTAGAAASGLVAALFDGRSALSMSAVIAACSLLALIGYILVARSAERRTHSKAVVASPVIEVAAGLPEKL